ncbi:MAG: hypothetical protein M1827_001216 [Pycnora praestabilis]|nr:MAG: hypothetical protein M1827_001216 [Pycnora praestabilis]
MSSGAPIAGYVDPSFPDPNGSNDAPTVIYGKAPSINPSIKTPKPKNSSPPPCSYTPSLVLAILGTILFTLSTLLHSYQLRKYRTWYFAPLTIGTTLEVIGYLFRILSNKLDPYSVIYFVVQYFFIVVAPVFFSAAIYTILSILINAVGRQSSPLPPRVVLAVFVACDIIATVVQIAGAASIGQAESNDTDPTTANNILLAGLAFQVSTFLIFVTLLSLFLHRASKVVKHGIMMPFTFALCAATALVYLRTVFRLAETAQGLRAYLDGHEVFFGCLEFAPVVVAVLLFNVWHPGMWVERYRTGVEDATVERIAEGEEETGSV